MEFAGHGFGQVDAAAFHHDVDVVAGALQEEVAHVAADDEGAHTHLPRRFGDDRKHFPVQSLLKHSAKIQIFVSL